MKNIIFPDYEHSILNLINSILKHYNVDTKYNSLPKLEKELAKNFKTEFDKLIAEMKKRKQESSKWRFNKCDVYDWDKLEKTIKDFYANIHI